MCHEVFLLLPLIPCRLLSQDSSSSPNCFHTEYDVESMPICRRRCILTMRATFGRSKCKSACSCSRRQLSHQATSAQSAHRLNLNDAGLALSRHVYCQFLLKHTGARVAMGEAFVFPVRHAEHHDVLSVFNICARITAPGYLRVRTTPQTTRITRGPSNGPPGSGKLCRQKLGGSIQLLRHPFCSSSVSTLHSLALYVPTVCLNSLGPLRFSLPFANAPYSGAYDASKYGPSCPQQIGDLPLLPEGSASDIATFVTATVYGVALPDDEDCE